MWFPMVTRGSPCSLPYTWEGSEPCGMQSLHCRIAFGPHGRTQRLSRGITTRMACGPERMECEAAIQAFEASMRYRLDGERCCSKATSLRRWSFIAVRW